LGSNEFIKVQAFLKSRDNYATLFPFYVNVKSSSISS